MVQGKGGRQKVQVIVLCIAHDLLTQKGASSTHATSFAAQNAQPTGVRRWIVLAVVVVALGFGAQWLWHTTIQSKFSNDFKLLASTKGMLVVLSEWMMVSLHDAVYVCACMCACC